MIQDDNFLTIKQAAKYLNVHWQTIRNQIKAGTIQTIKIGRTIRIKKEDLEKLGDEKNNDQIHEIELRYILKDRNKVEEKLRKLGAKLTNHSHIIDHYYSPNHIKNMQDKDIFFDSPTGYAVRIRELDNDYSGRITTTLEVKKLAGPDYKDHSNCLEEEFVIPDYESVHKAIIMMNNKEFVTIDKERFVYRIDEIKFCFDTIVGFGYGLEIEIMTTKSVQEAHNRIKEFAYKLGLKDSDQAKNSFTYMIIEKMAKF